MAETYDAIVIGAGIMGASTAYELAQKGLRVALFEKGSIGAGSTGKSSAIIRQHYSNEVTARMARYSLGVFRNFSERVGGESGFIQTGFLVLTREEDLEGLRANVALQQRVGIETELLSADEVRRRWPFLETRDLVAAAYEPHSGHADPNLTLNSYVQAARRLGAKLYQDTPVTAIRIAAGKVVGVDTPRGAFDAPLVLNSAGPWGARVAAMAGVEVPIMPCRVQVALYRRPQPGLEHPVVADFVNAVYWRTETGEQTLVGLIDPEEANAIVDPDTYNERVDVDFAANAGERLVRRFPMMAEGDYTGGFAALYAITPDWHPILDELIPGSGLFICAGFSGHGFKLGPAVGRMAAAMMLGEEDPEFDRRLFRLSRYAEGEPVRGQYEYSIVG